MFSYNDFQIRLAIRFEGFALNALLVLDKDSKTKLSEDLRVKVVRTLEEKGH